MARERRSVQAIFGRAVLAGLLFGAAIGAALVLPDLLEQQFAPEPDVGRIGGWSDLLVAAPVGALVGLPPALVAAFVWALTEPRWPRLARAAATAGAAVTIGLIALVIGDFPSVFGALCAGVAAVLAFALAPAITSRRVASSGSPISAGAASSGA